jgi:hypothetical protein
MSLPTPEQLQELSQLIVEHGKLTKGKWYTFKGMLQSLERARGTIAASAVGSGAQSAVIAAAGAGGIHSGLAAASAMGVTLVTFAPLSAVVAPWIAAADIARQAGDIFELHDLVAMASGKAQSHKYFCKCGKCAANIKYVVDKKERNVARVAVGVFTFGLSAIATSAYSVYKSFQSGRPKEMTSRGLVDAARNGCTAAIAAIFLMAGNWQFLRGGNAGIMRRAIAIITSEDGWEVLKAEW